MTDVTGRSPGTGHAVLVGAVLGAAGTTAAVLFKLRCGVPSGIRGQYMQWCYSDIPALWAARGLDTGAVPYLDTAVEYPPLTGLWMWLAGLAAVDTLSFMLWTAAILVASGAVTGALLASTVGIGRTMVFALAPTLLVTGALNWDLPAVALATAGLVAHRRGRDGWAGAWLGLGTAAKLWPALLLPAVVLAAGARAGRSGALRAVAGAGGAWLAVNLPVALAAPTNWARFLELSRERPADWDSLWSIVPRSTGVVLDTDAVNLGVAVLTVAGVVVLLALVVRWDPPGRWHLVGLPLVAWFLLVGKVYSPQFSLWLLPLLALAMPPVWTLVALGVAELAVNLTRLSFLGTVVGLEDGASREVFEATVVVRAVVVAVVAVWGWRREAARGDHRRAVLRLGQPAGGTT